MIRKLLLALALLFTFSAPALAVHCGDSGNNCFWVGGAGTWDGAANAHWADTSGGTGGCGLGTCGPPATNAAVTCDANSGGGAITVNTNFTVDTLTTGACVNTLEFGTNNNSPTITTSWNGSGAGVWTLHCGTGTFSFPATTGNPINFTTTTNLTLTCSSATFALTSTNTATNRSVIIGSTALTWPTITIAANSGPGDVTIQTGNGITTTITGLTINAPNTVDFPRPTGNFAFSNAPTFVGGSITNLISMIGTGCISSNMVATPMTITGAVNGSWVLLRCMAFTDSSNITFSSSFDLGKNSITGGGVLSITTPSTGSGGFIIGGG